MSWKDTGYAVSYGRDIPYYTLEEMKKSVHRCMFYGGRDCLCMILCIIWGLCLMVIYKGSINVVLVDICNSRQYYRWRN